MTTFTLPAETVISEDPAANLAAFLLLNTGSIYGTWRGAMPAAAQRKLFGRYFGRGTLVLDGAAETISRFVTVCFGLDFERVDFVRLVDLPMIAATAKGRTA